MDALMVLFYLFNAFVFIYVLLVDAFYLLFFYLSLKQMNMYLKGVSYQDDEELSISQLMPPVSIIIPAFNEETIICDSIKSLFYLNYPQYEVIVVNDGSNDETFNRLKEEFDLMEVQDVIRQQIRTKKIYGIYRSLLHPNLVVVDKENGGKSDALNAGINASTYPYFCNIDADSILEPNSLIKTMRPFIEGTDGVVACGGIVRIANGCAIENGQLLRIGLPKSKLALFQVIEYLRSFLIGRLGLSAINNLLIISGAFGVFRKRDVIEIGGYSTETIGEDMELVVRLQKYLYDKKIKGKVLFLPQPICWTEAPESLSILYRQRKRWHIGLLQTVLKHREVLFNPKYKGMGLVVMPYFLIVELFGPAIELVGTVFILLGLYLDIVNIPFAIMFFVATLIFGIFLSVGAVLLEEYNFHRYPRVRDLFRLSFYSIIENFGYRQLNAVWRTWAFVQFWKKDFSWGLITRKGFSANADKEMKM